MTYRGKIQNGVVVLETGPDVPAPPEGAEVSVEVVDGSVANAGGSGTVGERLLRFSGTIEGLPADLAKNHDHYAHGAPKRP